MKKRFGLSLCAASLLIATLFTGCDDDNDNKSIIELAKPVSDVAAQTALVPVELPVVYSGYQAGSWTADFAAAKQYASEHKMPILLYFAASDRSKDCQTLANDVFLKETWKKFASEKLVPVYIDFTSQPPAAIANDNQAQENLVRQNVTLQQQYGVQGYPALLLVEGDGTPISEILTTGTGTQDTAVIRNIRRAMRNRVVFLEAILSRMPEAMSADINSKREQIKGIQEDMKKISEEANKRIRELNAEIVSLAPAIEATTTEWILSQKPEEVRKRYADAKAAFERVEKAQRQWLDTKPVQNQENNLIYSQFLKELSENSDIMDDCLAGEE